MIEVKDGADRMAMIRALRSHRMDCLKRGCNEEAARCRAFERLLGDC